VPAEKAAKAGKAGRGRKERGGERLRGGGGAGAAAAPLDAAAQARFAALKAWRTEVAKAHNVPAYVVFHDATLAQMARECPASAAALGGISGVGAKKLERYGEELLRLLAPG
ncbi:MAG: HRDC domain-containing protein, partial [Rubrivivax sp.]|nr:HRDC domain-containing protein [Rubrivivax sp.]